MNIINFNFPLDYVFLINVHDSSLGFPSTIENDPILNLVIDDFDAFEHEEERRLFCLRDLLDSQA